MLLVVGRINGVGNLINQSSLLDDEEEKQAIDEVDKLLVELGGIHSTVDESTAQSVVALPFRCQHRVADGFHRGLHGTRQAITNAVARFDAHVEPTLHDARLVVAGVEAGGMEQAEHQAELGVFVFLQHATEVELNVGEFHQLPRVANQAHNLAVADDTIHVFRGIEIFEHGGVGRFLAHGTLGAMVERAFVQRVDASVGTGVVSDNDKRHVAQLRAGVADVVACASHCDV